jgi:NitT/TauT family transport system substrate-binding protein
MRRVPALWLALVALVFAPVATPAQTSTTLHLSTNPIDSGAEVFYAKERGTFAKNGLDVTIQPGQSGAAIAAAVASGAIDIGYADLGALAKAHVKGIDFVVLAPAALWLTNAPVNKLIVSKNSAIHSARDLAGKVIAVPGLGTAAEYAVHAWLDASGGDSTSVKYIELAYAAMPAALEAGRIDAAHVAEPFISQALQTGRVLASADDALGPEYLRTVWFSTRAWAQRNPDAVARFVAAMRETATWANAKGNQAKSAEILEKYAKIDPAQAGTMVRARYGEALGPALLQPEIDATAKYGNFTPFPADELLYHGR